MTNKMKKIARILFFYALFDALILGYAGFIPGMSMAAAQTSVSITTLASAMTATGQGSTTYVNLTALTCAGCPGTIIVAGSTYLYIDGEFMAVNALPGGTIVQVTRGYSGGGAATKHNSGALVFVGPATAFQSYDPSGYCVRGNLLFVPWIDVKDGLFSDCLNGQFVTGQLSQLQNAFFRILAPDSGGTAYTSLNTNGTTLVAGTLYCVEADLHENKYLTGIGILNGTTAGGTDKHLVVLLDAGGNVIANSALAGAASSGTSAYQKYAFTSPIYAVGPAQYFACAQSNGTTDTIRMVVTGTQDTYLTTSKTGSFGTIPTITVPTTFTSAVGPYTFLY